MQESCVGRACPDYDKWDESIDKVPKETIILHENLALIGSH